VVPLDVPGDEDEVERRGGVRGPVVGLTAAVGGLPPAPILEAGRTALFVALDEPDVLPLGELTTASLAGRGRTARAQVDVIRKEVSPRRGVALLIVHMAPADEEAWAAMRDV